MHPQSSNIRATSVTTLARAQTTTYWRAFLRGLTRRASVHRRPLNCPNGYLVATRSAKVQRCPLLHERDVTRTDVTQQGNATTEKIHALSGRPASGGQNEITTTIND